MKNKVLIKLIIPELNTSYDMFIPVNEMIWKVNALLLKAISDLTNGAIDTKERYLLLNKDNSKVYQNNEIIINTEIRNGTELVLLSNKNNYDENLRTNYDIKH